MRKRLARLHRAVVDALAEADEIRAIGIERSDPIAMNDIGIALDKAREAIEQLVWPEQRDNHPPLQ